MRNFMAGGLENYSNTPTSSYGYTNIVGEDLNFLQIFKFLPQSLDVFKSRKSAHMHVLLKQLLYDIAFISNFYPFRDKIL